MFRGDDPIFDHISHEAKRERWISRRPVCCECRDPIQSKELYDFNGKLICPECLVENHLKETEDYTA